MCGIMNYQPHLDGILKGVFSPAQTEESILI